MELGQPRKRSARESVVPMINVVFLLLIFFLMSAQIAPPEPFEVEPPHSSAQNPAEGQRTLYVAASGEMVLGDLRGEDIFAGLDDLGAGEPLIIRADRGVAAAQIAALLPRLAALGVERVKLVSRAR